MPGLVDSIRMWKKPVLYGIMVILYILKQLITKGPGKVFSWKKRDRPRHLDDPSLGTHGFLTLKDVRIHYVASGPEDKPMMLFVHGFPEFWYSWRYQIKEFQKDYRVIAIDQRGFSESSKPQGIHNYSITKLMCDIEQIIKALGYKSCVLVAHDWGGLIAWAFGKHYSHMVDKLIVMNAPPVPVFRKLLGTNKEQEKKSWYCFFFNLPFLPELAFKTEDFAYLDALLSTTYKSEGSKDAADKAREEHIDPYKYTFLLPGALTSPLNYYRHLVRNMPDKGVYDHDLEYTMPALLIWGCDDLCLDIANPDTIEKEAPTIEVRRIPDSNHFVQIHASDAVNKIMREWLNKY